MIESHYFILVASAGVLTLAWLFLQQNVAFTSIAASALWFYAAYSGGNVVRVTRCCVTDVSSPQLQYVSLAMGIISLLARLLYSLGEYPPNEQAAGGSQPAEPAD